MINSEGTSKFVPLPACCHDWSSNLAPRLRPRLDQLDPVAHNFAQPNRIMWKVLSTLLLMTYLYTVMGSPMLTFMGVVFLLKLLIEIWSQQTPTWIAPSTWPLLIGLSLWRRLRLAHAFC